MLKIDNYIEKHLISSLPKLLNLLMDGHLKKYEEDLFGLLISVQNFISKQLLPLASSQVYEQLKEQEKKQGGRNIVVRELTIRTSTGYQIKVSSPYVKRTKTRKKGQRHLLGEYWNVIGGASPVLYDRVSYCSAIGPSYDIAHQTLIKFGTAICLSSVRDITNSFAAYCYDYGEENLQLAGDENLSGKTVVIALDGGRTRTREYREQRNENGHLSYEEKWKEPKLFVIDILDKNGQPDRHKLPIYGCRFDETDVLELLEKYLKKLKIKKAKRVQIIADGALWIWDKLKPLLLKLEVKPQRIIETLDYYHASEYVYRLVSKMPKRISKHYREAYLKRFNRWLWEGESARIAQVCESIYKRPSKEIKRSMRYLSKHQAKTQYAEYKENSLMCGSGIIESGIRRVINLRFKNASTFWGKENVEKLYFLRAALLSKRWNLVMENISNAA